MQGKGVRGEVGLVPRRVLVPGEDILDERLKMSLKNNPILVLSTVRSSDLILCYIEFTLY